MTGFEPKENEPSLLPRTQAGPPGTLRALASSLTPRGPSGRTSPGRLLGLGVVAAGLTLGAAYWLRGQEDGDMTARRVEPHVLCGAQPRTTSAGKVERWHDPEVTIHIDDSVDRLGPWARQAVQVAYGTWLQSGADVPELTFDSTTGTQLAVKQDGKNTVFVAPITIEGHEDDLAITIAYASVGSGKIVEADVVINSKYPFQDVGASDFGRARSTLAVGTDLDGSDACEAPPPEGCPGDYDLQSVMVHEVGHFFGLGEERQKPADSMYYCTAQCELKKRSLSVDDQDSLLALYEAGAQGEPTIEQGAVGCGGATVAGDGSGLGGLSWAAGIALALGLARRRRHVPR